MDLDREAARRRALCENNPTSTPLAPGYELTGVRGEELFRREFKLPSPHLVHDGPGGDGGVDFHIDLQTRAGRRRCSVDVKSAHHRNPQWLWVKLDPVEADVFVLASIDDDIGDTLVGWATKAEVLAAPITTDGGITHYAVHRRKLRPMRTLHELHECPS
jgi:hypothetical protein